MKKAIAPEKIAQIRELVKDYSDSEIATMLNIHVQTVIKNSAKHNIKRTDEEKTKIRSRIRTELVKAEKRRAIFGLEQQTGIKIFSNPEKIRLRRYFRRLEYIIPERNSMLIYYSKNTHRNIEFEERGLKVGFRFLEIKTKKIYKT